VWWHTPVIQLLRGLRQKDNSLQTSLGNLVRSYLKKKKLKRVGVWLSGRMLLACAKPMLGEILSTKKEKEIG
jgi:hypothetical protein